MSNKKLVLFVICVALQLFVIGGLFAQRLFTRSTGTEVVLRTVPVDPRDLIRGEYVALRYDISSVSQYLADGESFAVGDTVYVTLEKGYQGLWSAASISKTRPRDYSVAIKGKVTSITNNVNIWPGDGGKNIGVEYGIERYFVEAGKGKELERSGRLKVFVKVDGSGAAVIERVEPTDAADLETDEIVPEIPQPVSGSDAVVRSSLSAIYTRAGLFRDQFQDYGEPFAVAACPTSGGSIMFFRDERIRQALVTIKNNAASPAGVRCAAGSLGTALEATSWAVSATVRSGGSWCVSSANALQRGTAFGGGAEPAVCR